MERMENIKLISKSLYCEFDRENGALVKITAPEMDWNILDRAELGLSFKLMVPLSEELRNNSVFGEKQKLSSFEEQTDYIIFKWDDLKSERGGVLPIGITMKISVEDRQIVYSMSVDNRSDFFVESVHCPYLGDIRPPADAEWLKSFSFGYATSMEFGIWPDFQNLIGYYGVDHPTHFAGTPPFAPYCLIRSETEGLYAGAKANSPELVAFNVELRPGWESSINELSPQTDEIASKPVHRLFAAIHMPYIQPGEFRELTPIALEAYKGDWQQGVDIYKKWTSSWLKHVKAPDWVNNPHSWLQLHINSPEDELRMRFTELPKVAEECKRYGVEVIQLVGWNDGGQDQGNPSHDPDPRLGTYDQLKNAIKKCHDIGIKVIIFTKFTWADRATEWFRNELKDLAIADPYGDYYMHPGYQYQTAAQLLHINTKRLIPMCFLSEKYIEICQKEFQKVVKLGAAGMLFDESMHHNPALLCFNQEHGHRYGAPAYQNDREFIMRLWETDNVPSDFLMAGEACYDWEMEVYQLSYHRSQNKKHVPLSRYMQPHAQFMTAVTGFDDRNMINQCLMFRYIISYEPYFFKGRLGDYPDTVTYGQQMDALRDEYRKWFWDGEFQSTCGVVILNNKDEPHPTYSVFKASDDSLGVVVVNYEDEPVTITAGDIKSTFKKYRQVDGASELNFEGTTEIPARSAIVII